MDAKTLQLKITLAGLKPPIWRRFRVSELMSLADLHTAIQITMGWHDEQLLEAVSNSSHPDHVDLSEWLDPGFNPTAFDRDSVNVALGRAFWSVA